MTQESGLLMLVQIHTRGEGRGILCLTQHVVVELLSGKKTTTPADDDATEKILYKRIAM